MAASLHLAAYTPRAAGRMLRRMSREQTRLEAAPGVAVARVCMTAELETLAGGVPSLVRWGLMCGWESAAARDEALADGRLLAPFLAEAEESWSVSLDTVLVRQGTWHGWQPSTEGVRRLERDEPVAVVTYGTVRPRHLPAFTWHNRRVVKELAPNPGHVFRVGIGDTPLARGTFSLWRSQGEVVRFAYGRDGIHDPVQRRSLDPPWADDYFFARFRPVAATGTWRGRDPLAALA